MKLFFCHLLIFSFLITAGSCGKNIKENEEETSEQELGALLSTQLNLTKSEETLALEVCNALKTKYIKLPTINSSTRFNFLVYTRACGTSTEILAGTIVAELMTPDNINYYYQKESGTAASVFTDILTDQSFLLKQICQHARANIITPSTATSIFNIVDQGNIRYQLSFQKNNSDHLIQVGRYIKQGDGSYGRSDILELYKIYTSQNTGITKNIGFILEHEKIIACSNSTESRKQIFQNYN